MCAKTVWQYNKAGAAGLHLEDQQFPKRCGHLDGKSLIPVEDMVKKIEICAHTRDACSKGDFIICARTDARGVEGIESTVKRSLAYIKAGADMIFPEGLENVDEFEYIAKELRKHNPEISSLQT
jgi:methylisocitrate lyase